MATTTAPVGQVLVLIGSDGKRASVSRAIATEASYVLRDLLDGYDVLMQALRDRHPQHATATATATSTATASTDLPDLLDFGTASSNGTAAPAANKMDAAMHTNDNVAVAHVGNGNGEDNTTTAAADAAVTTMTTRADGADVEAAASDDVIELPFPYFTGDILERVCAHMTYRFRVSTFGAEGGQCQVYPVRMRDIARPMTLPLSEYLDAANRRCIADWDEKTTVWMIKAATLLHYDELLQLASAKLATHLSEKSIDGVRILLGVKNDFAPAEEAELHKEHMAEVNK